MNSKKIILATVTLCLLLSADIMICVADEAYLRDGEYLTYEINDNGEAVITGGEPVDNKLVIPNSIDGYHVVGVAERAFSYRQDIYKLTIEDQVRYIGAYAFAGCRYINVPDLGEGLQAIGEGAFRDTLIWGDRKIYGSESKGFLPDSLMSIDKEAFACCSRLEDIELPSHADIASDAFEDTPWQEARDEVFKIRGSCLEHINNNMNPVLYIPYGVTELAQGDWMSGSPIMDEVSQETEYEEIIFPDTIVELGDSCLGCISIKRIEMPDGIKNIQHSAFRYGKVSEIVLSEKTEVIGHGAFYGVDGFETIHIPASVQVIEDDAFAQCWDLCQITIPKTVETLGENMFFECRNLTKVIYEEGIQEIGCGYKDTAIERLQFPESTVSIRAGISGGFWCTPNLERVYIPAGATDLDDNLLSVRAQFLNDGLTVYGQKGSRAEELAVQSGYTFVEVESGDEMP